MKDYSEIMQDLPRVQREREDALRSEDWQKAIKLTIEIGEINYELRLWIIKKKFMELHK
jgi:hypothetical protein